MAFATVEEYKKTVLDALTTYQKFFFSKHSDHVEDLKNQIKETEYNTTNELSDFLYERYLDLLNRTNSIKLARSIAIVLATAWDISLEIVNNYHDMRKKPNQKLIGTALWFTDQQNEYFGNEKTSEFVKGQLDVYAINGTPVKYPKTQDAIVNDPIISFKKNKAILDIIKENKNKEEPEDIELTERTLFGK